MTAPRTSRTLTRRSAVLALLAASVVLTGACSTGSGTDAGRATDAATSAPTTAAEPWSNAEAGEKYLEYVKPVNDAILRLQALGAGATVTDTAKACADVANYSSDVVRQMGAALDEKRWPPVATPQVNAFVDAVVADRETWVACAQSKDPAEIEAALGKLGALKSPAAAAELRQVLGVSPVSSPTTTG